MEWLIVGVIAAGVFLALRYLKRHGNTCGGDCANCTGRCRENDKT